MPQNHSPEMVGSHMTSATGGKLQRPDHWTGAEWTLIYTTRSLLAGRRHYHFADSVIASYTHPWNVPWHQINEKKWLSSGTRLEASRPLEFLCQLFNSRTGNKCRFQPCKFHHTCSECGGPHPASQCRGKAPPARAWYTRRESPNRGRK